MTARTLHYYAAFGGVLCSTLEFPELRAISTAPADWTLDVRIELPARSDVVPVGERHIGIESYALSQCADGYRLSYSHAGTFDIDVANRVVTWYPTPGASTELARVIVLGPVFALLLESAGHFCLHGSGVVTATGAIVFIGPKHYGKSTLALALTAAGCQLASDDTVAIMPGPPPMLRPSVPTMRLWDDTALKLNAEALCDLLVAGTKMTVGGFRETSVAERPARLSAIYALAPVVAEDEQQTVTRQAVQGAEAVVTLAQQRKLPDILVGMTSAGVQLTQATAVAGRVPVYTLHIARDFTRLPNVIAQLLEWHGGPAAGQAGIVAGANKPETK